MFFCIDIWIGGKKAKRFWFVPPSSDFMNFCGAAALKAVLEGLGAAELREGGETHTNQGQFCQVTGKQNDTFNITVLRCGRSPVFIPVPSWILKVNSRFCGN